MHFPKQVGKMALFIFILMLGLPAIAQIGEKILIQPGGINRGHSRLQCSTSFNPTPTILRSRISGSSTIAALWYHGALTRDVSRNVYFFDREDLTLRSYPEGSRILEGEPWEDTAVNVRLRPLGVDRDGNVYTENRYGGFITKTDTEGITTPLFYSLGIQKIFITNNKLFFSYRDDSGSESRTKILKFSLPISEATDLESGELLVTSVRSFLPFTVSGNKLFYVDGNAIKRKAPDSTVTTIVFEGGSLTSLQIQALSADSCGNIYYVYTDYYSDPLPQVSRIKRWNASTDTVEILFEIDDGEAVSLEIGKDNNLYVLKKMAGEFDLLQYSPSLEER